MVEEHRKALYDPEALDAWIKKWVLDCPAHEDYLRKVGYDKILALKNEARIDTETFRLTSILEKVSSSVEFNEREMMIVAGARKIREAVLNREP